jgi:RNA polymerase sigma-70 factor (ECF subfamily)
MTPEEVGQRLSQIATRWSLIWQAHQGTACAARAAHNDLAQRYRGAVYRYLLGAVHNPDVADDLAQRFFVGLLRGELRQADPQRGRFRSLVKTALFRLVARYRREEKRAPRPLSPGDPALAGRAAEEARPEGDGGLLGLDEAGEPAPDDGEEGGAFDAGWRNELLTHTWQALARANPEHYEVLLFRARNPRMTSQQMAEHLGAQRGRPLKAEALRQELHRARESFTRALLGEVAHYLGDDSNEALAEELCQMQLWEYLSPAWRQRLGGPALP